MILKTCAFLGNVQGPDFIVLMIGILDILALVEILKSRADSSTKLLWVIVIWFIPLIGLLLYYNIGRPVIRSA